MTRVTRIQTSDGVLHDNFLKAERHAEERYGKALTDLAHKAIRIEKYVAMAAFFEDNLALLVELKALRDDIQLAPPGDEVFA